MPDSSFGRVATRIERRDPGSVWRSSSIRPIGRRPRLQLPEPRHAQELRSFQGCRRSSSPRSHPSPTSLSRSRVHRSAAPAPHLVRWTSPATSLPDRQRCWRFGTESGALTFHAPVETTRPTCGGPSEVRFIVPVPRPERSPASRGAVTQAIKAIVVKVAGHAADAAVGLVLGKLARALKHRPGSARSSREGWLKVDKATLSAGRLAVRRGEHRATPRRGLITGVQVTSPADGGCRPAARTSPLYSRP